MAQRLFEKYFPLEFSYDKYGEWCTAANSQLCFQFRPSNDVDEKKIKRIVDVINGVSNTVFDHEYTYDGNGYVIENGVPLILIRGWGYLTSSGGLNLPAKEAAAVQDDLGNYIVERLTKKK